MLTEVKVNESSAWMTKYILKMHKRVAVKQQHFLREELPKTYSASHGSHAVHLVCIVSDHISDAIMLS
jgi:hypothetical protein